MNVLHQPYIQCLYLTTDTVTDSPHSQVNPTAPTIVACFIATEIAERTSTGIGT